MFVIFPDIHDLKQANQNLSSCKPEECPSCKCPKVHYHASYNRHPCRGGPSKDCVNPIKIPRFRCVGCGITFSVLPECLPPRRWYDWNVQGEVLKEHLAGLSVTAIAKKFTPSRSTITRWMRRFSECFCQHSDHLRQKISSLCFFSEWKPFWNECLKKITLAKTMFLLHNADIRIP